MKVREWWCSIWNVCAFHLREPPPQIRPFPTSPSLFSIYFLFFRCFSLYFFPRFCYVFVLMWECRVVDRDNVLGRPQAFFFICHAYRLSAGCGCPGALFWEAPAVGGLTPQGVYCIPLYPPRTTASRYSTYSRY